MEEGGAERVGFGGGGEGEGGGEGGDDDAGGGGGGAGGGGGGGEQGSSCGHLIFARYSLSCWDLFPRFISSLEGLF